MKKILYQTVLPAALVLIGVGAVMVMNNTASSAQRMPQNATSQTASESKTQGAPQAKPNQNSVSQRPSGRGGRFGATTSATVDSMTLEPADWSAQLVVFGKTFSYQQRQLTASVASEVKRIAVKAGQRVVAGQVLMTLDDEDLQRSYAQAQIQRDNIDAQLRLFDLQAAADVENLKIEQALLDIQHAAVKRYENLTNLQLSSSNDYETALSGYQSQLKSLQAQQLAIAKQKDELAQLQIQKKEQLLTIESLQSQLDDAIITAPFSGVIATVAVEEGEQVTANQHLVTVFDDQQLGIETKIPLSQAAGIIQAERSVKAFATIAGQSVSLVMTDLDSISVAGSLAAKFQFTQPVFTALGEHEPLTIELPPQSGVYAVPASSLYENKLIYKISGQSLVDAEVNVIGHTIIEGNTWYIFASQHVQPGDKVLITRLPNASRGLQISLPENQSRGQS